MAAFALSSPAGHRGRACSSAHRPPAAGRLRRQRDRLREPAARDAGERLGRQRRRATRPIQGFATATSVNAGVAHRLQDQDRRPRPTRLEDLPARLVPGQRSPRGRDDQPLGRAPADAAAVRDRRRDRDLRLRRLGGVGVLERPGDRRVRRLHRPTSSAPTPAATPHIPFVVRNDGNTSDARLPDLRRDVAGVQHLRRARTSTTGKANGRAYKITYNRPYATRGTGRRSRLPLLQRVPDDPVPRAERDRRLLRLGPRRRERPGPAAPSTRPSCRSATTSTGPRTQRKNVTDARDAGVNLALLRRQRRLLEDAPASRPRTGRARPNRTLVDLQGHLGRRRRSTRSSRRPTWRDPRFGDLGYGYGPENALIGTQFQANSVDLAIQVSADEGKLRLWRDTSPRDDGRGRHRHPERPHGRLRVQRGRRQRLPPRRADRPVDDERARPRST